MNKVWIVKTPLKGCKTKSLNIYNKPFKRNKKKVATKEKEALKKQQTQEQQKKAERAAKQREKFTQNIIGTFVKSAAHSLDSSTGQKIMRSLLSSLFGKRQFNNLIKF